jgi:hypothetical protein
MHRLSLVTTGTAVTGTALLLLFVGFLSPASAGSPINFISPALEGILLCSDVRLAQDDESGNFDRESCEQTCRYRYGASQFPGMQEQDWGGSVSYSQGYYLLTQCIDSCNRRFWRDYDRKMENPQKSR